MQGEDMTYRVLLAPEPKRDDDGSNSGGSRPVNEHDRGMRWPSSGENCVKP